MHILTVIKKKEREKNGKIIYKKVGKPTTANSRETERE
jgi:hypothetical protein